MYSHHSDKGTNVASKGKFKVNDVLLDINGWRLVRALYPDLVSCKSYIVHMECDGDGFTTLQGVGTRVKNMCIHCGKTPPPEILGLEILHNGKI